MKWLLIDEGRVREVNARLPEYTNVSPVRLTTGELVISASVLTDCGPGQTYGAAEEILRSLPLVEGEPVRIEA